MEGKIRYLKVQNWTKQMSALDYMSEQQRQKMSYMWGNDSEWKTYTELYFSPTRSKYLDSDEKAEANMEGYNGRKDVYFIQRNFEQNSIHDAIQLLGKTYIVEDSLQCQSWKIKNDMKEVAGHICMNAFWRDTIKQQDITAWFALDMPNSAGPERFCGLPGMILEIDINDGAMNISADKIELMPVGEKLELPKKIKGKKIKEVDFQNVIATQIEDKRKTEQPWMWGMRY